MVFDARAGVSCDTDIFVEVVGRHLGSGVARHDWGKSRLEKVRLDWDWMIVDGQVR